MNADHREHSAKRITKQFPQASLLQRDILRTLLYFDIFDHPLTPEEIYRFLPSNSTSIREIERACDSPPLSSMVTFSEGFFFVSTSGLNLSRERIAKEHRAERYWRVARIMGAIIRSFPFVRGVFVSGELSKGVIGRNGDIDFFVVTAENRLWIARSFLILFKKLFLFNSKKFFCVNHLVTESYLDVAERNFYTAIEIATLKPLSNPSFLNQYVEHNTWIRSFLPNFSLSPPQANKRLSKSVVQTFFEAPFSGSSGDKLDKFLLSFWRRTWNKRYAHFAESKRNELFRSEPFLSTAYGGDFLHRILDEYQRRLKIHGLDNHD